MDITFVYFAILDENEMIITDYSTDFDGSDEDLDQLENVFLRLCLENTERKYFFIQFIQDKENWLSFYYT